jgi:tRNA(Ile)-lysidine synthase
MPERSSFEHSPSTAGTHMRLAARVLDALRRQDVAPGARVLVALSGGGDSVALLVLMRSLHASGDLVLAGAAHLNHQLRGADSDDDEGFCRAVCARLAVPFIAAREDVAEVARRDKRSLEDAARRTRYGFLTMAADDLGADVIATGHTRDDQAETFLLRILRGAGTRGLAGIRPRAGRVVRPLLEVGRDELRAYLAAEGETFREDASNADVRLTRNRVRHEVLPLLRSRFSDSVAGVLAREAELARRDEDFLQRQAIDLARSIVLSENYNEVTFTAAPLVAAHPALGSRVAQTLLERGADRHPIGFEHVERLLDFAAGGSDGAIALPGQSAIREDGAIILRLFRGASANPVNSFAFPLSIPGEVQSADWTIAACELDRASNGAWPRWQGRGNEVGIAAGGPERPLVVRNRRPGDRFRPLGAPGKRKLQDFLVDRKVPRRDREGLPLVVDARGRIVWVPGQAVADDFKVSDTSQSVILLRVRRLGEK